MIDEVTRGVQRMWNPTRMMSDDGATIAFSTTEPLSPWDANQQPDVYMWRADTGQLTMLTDGIASAVSSFNASSVTGYAGMSASGDSIFFTSYRPLLKEHTSGQVATFVVRRNGGFRRAAERSRCSGDGCQGPASPSPVLPAIGPNTFGGDGNVLPTPGPVEASVGVSKSKGVSGSIAKLRVRVPDGGRISVTGSSIRRTGRSAAKAGTYTVKIALSSKARRSLKKKTKLTVSARVSYRAKGGQAASKIIKVTFKQPKRTKRRASVLLSATPKGR